MKSVLLLFTCGALLMAQDPRGSISGQVFDSTGAVMPGVAVRATNVETNVIVSATANALGAYEIPYLNPGPYRIDAELTGFKKWSRPGIDLRAGDKIRLDVSMTPGDVKEVMEVAAEAPVLEAATASVSQVMSSKTVGELPLRSGSVAYLFTMGPATVITALPYDGPWNVDQSSNISVAGGRATTADYNVDGVSNNGKGGTTAFVPPADMVQEVRVETTSYDAAIGHGAAGSVNIALKSGTNTLHGNVGASVSSGPMMTRNFFSNRFIFDPATGPITPAKIKANTPSSRWLRESVSIGGPVYIPKLYNGRNKTFWMFGYQAHNRRRPVATQHTVPIEAQRNGDFSALLAISSQYQIYDPFSIAPAPNGRFSRQPLPGNRIPSNRIDAASKNLLKYFPAPNTAGTVDGLNNYSRTRQDTQDLYQPLARVDHNFSEKHRMFARYTHSDFFGHFDELVSGSTVRGRKRRRPHRGVALDNVFVMSNSLVLDVRYGFTWFQEYQSFDNIGWDLKEFGFPSSLISQLPPSAVSFPQIMVSGLLQLGNDGGFKQPTYNHTLLTVLNWNRGAHSMRIGFDGRSIYDNAYNYGNVSPRLDFGETFTRGPLDNSVVAPTGQALASFLYGIPTGGFVDVNASKAEHSTFYSAFLADDWRVRRTLTLNLGLRWEVEAPVTERYNRSTRDFDFVTPNPVQAAAVTAYARSPIPQVPVADFKVLGGPTFLGTNGLPRTQRNTDLRAWMPRIGFAWQARPKMVVRGGVGLFFGLVGADFADVNQPGYSQRSNVIASNDNGQTYVASISNPLPTGLLAPMGNSAGLMTFLGQTPGFASSDGRRPYTQRWSTSIQYEPMAQTVLEIGYIGSRSVRLRSSTEFNAVPRQFLSTSPARDQTVIDSLSAAVANPFFGIDGFQATNFYSNRNIGRAQLLRPLPHFGAIATGLPAGSSWYNALTLRAERRFSRGLMLQANYTWSKTLEAVDYLNPTDSRPQHVVSDLDRPHRITMLGMYELPFGKGRRFASNVHPVLDQIVGGWQTQAVWQLQSGPALVWGNIIYAGQFTDIALPTDVRGTSLWFNTSGFERANARQLANNIRTFPTRISGVRADGINVVDLSLFKTFRLHEKFRLQLRGEAEGAMNHPNLSPPNVAPTSTLFGTVNATQTGQEERRIFVGLKLMF
ncbi:MAG: carboxypeptidase regulatory-like domain-containing protein [Acidobacteria bacterium]|nr:carboxypeptidase regulatory-like domain-containing protein [Acidobacteriota bacterium]